MTSWDEAVDVARDCARDLIVAAHARGWATSIVNPFGESGREPDWGGWSVCVRCLHPRWPFAVVVWVEVPEDDGASGEPFAEVQVGQATPEAFGGDGWPYPLLTAPGVSAGVAMVEAHADGIDPALLAVWAERLDHDDDTEWAAQVRALADLQADAPSASAEAGRSVDGSADADTLNAARRQVARLEAALSLARAEVRDLERSQESRS